MNERARTTKVIASIHKPKRFFDNEHQVRESRRKKINRRVKLDVNGINDF